jgi:hypothetical protein
MLQRAAQCCNVPHLPASQLVDNFLASMSRGRYELSPLKLLPTLIQYKHCDDHTEHHVIRYLQAPAPGRPAPVDPRATAEPTGS